MTIFIDRSDAGTRLAMELSDYQGLPDVVVLALPRGGVPVGFEVAKALSAQLDVYVVRKLGIIGHEELAMGAIASGDVVVWNDDIITGLSISQEARDTVLAREKEELMRRESVYRGERPPIEIKGKTVILVDDGLATGASMRAAVTAVRTSQPSQIIVAVPTGPPETCESFKSKADEVVCLSTPQPFSAIGLWYSDFSQTTDQEVRDLLGQADILWRSGPGHYEAGGPYEYESRLSG